MGTQVETADGKVLAKRTVKAGVGPCVEFYFPHPDYLANHRTPVTPDGENRTITLHRWWLEQVCEGIHTASVFADGKVFRPYLADLEGAA